MLVLVESNTIKSKHQGHNHNQLTTTAMMIIIILSLGIQ
jgi:hypothetical protein